MIDTLFSFYLFFDDFIHLNFQESFILINDYEKGQKAGTFCPVSCSIIITIKKQKRYG
jgi:hypothetical protein